MHQLHRFGLFWLARHKHADHVGLRNIPGILHRLHFHFSSELDILNSIKMPARTRPVEKIAKASAQCSVEVGSLVDPLPACITDKPIGGGVRKVRCYGLQLSAQGYVCQGVHEIKGLLSCTC